MSDRSINPKKNAAILKAAVELFPKHGFEKTTMDDIAKRAGVTKQTVYSHFRNKEQLFIKMIDSLCSRAVAYTPVNTVKSKRFEHLLYDVGISVLSLITSTEGMAVTRLVIAEAANYPKVAKLYYESGTQRIMQLLAEFFDHQNAIGNTAIPNTQSAAAYFFALLKGQYFLRMTLGVPPIPSRKEMQAHVKEVVAIFLRLYGGRSPMLTSSSL